MSFIQLTGIKELDEALIVFDGLSEQWKNHVRNVIDHAEKQGSNSIEFIIDAIKLAKRFEAVCNLTSK